MTDVSLRPSTPRRPEPGILRIVDAAALALAVVAGFALVLLAVNVLVDVIGRAGFNQPFTGTLEYTENWWMPTLTLLAFAYTERRQEHIKVTILLDTLPIAMRRVVEGVFGTIATVLLLALAWHGLSEALEAAEYRQTTASSPPVAIWPFKFAAPLGVLALALQMAATSYRYLAGHLPRTGGDDHEGEAV
jgi:TRAP-type C4-dicarboxylate transport system permease small subunit